MPHLVDTKLRGTTLKVDTSKILMLAMVLSACLTVDMTRQKRLTKVQKEMLSQSPHVVKMTTYYVHFSSSFINKFCVDYHAGKTANAILKDSGIDPKILGDNRIESLRRIYRKVWLPRHADEPNRRNVTVDIAVDSKVLHEIEYLRQEVNALKKIILADLRPEEKPETFPKVQDIK